MRFVLVLVIMAACGGEEAPRELILPVDCFHWDRGATTEATAWRDHLIETRCPRGLGIATAGRDREGEYLQILCCWGTANDTNACLVDAIDGGQCCDPNRFLDECYSIVN